MINKFFVKKNFQSIKYDKIKKRNLFWLSDGNLVIIGIFSANMRFDAIARRKIKYRVLRHDDKSTLYLLALFQTKNPVKNINL